MLYYYQYNQYTEMFTILSAQNEFDYQAQAFSVLLHLGEYDQAYQFLNSISTITEGQMDYVTVQNLNLIRWSDPSNFNFTESRRNIVWDIAHKEHPYSAYAHSLWHLLTGEDIEYPLPAFIQSQQTEKRSKISTDEIKIYPNPTQNILHIQLDEGFSDLKNHKIRIMDYLGNTVYHEKNNEHNTMVDMSSFTNGVYIVIIENDRNIIKKSVILKVN